MALRFSPERLRSAREKAGLTQKGAAKALGVSYQTYQNWEYGSQDPRINQLLASSSVEFVSDAMKERQSPGSMGLLDTIYKGDCQNDLFGVRSPQEMDASCSDG